MKAHLLSFIFFCLGTASMAQANSGGFYTPERLPLRPENLGRAVRATPLLRTDLEYGSLCSSVMVSNDGYVLTNIHCVKLCTEKIWGLYDPNIEQIQKERYGFYNYTRFPNSTPADLVCPQYASVMDLEQYGLTKPRVVWIGRGRHTHTQVKIAQLSEDEFKSFSDLTEDAVVLKYERTKGHVPCLPLSLGEVRADEPVWLLGYPADTDRGSQLFRLSVSYGNVRRTVRQDPNYQLQALEVPQNLRSLFWERESQIWDQPHIITTDTDGYSGNSGGPLINAKSELIGLAFGMSTVSSKEYKGASLYAVKASHIWEKLVGDLGPAYAAEVFRCGVPAPSK